MAKIPIYCEYACIQDLMECYRLEKEKDFSSVFVYESYRYLIFENSILSIDIDINFFWDRNLNDPLITKLRRSLLEKKIFIKEFGVATSDFSFLSKLDKPLLFFIKKDNNLKDKGFLCINARYDNFANNDCIFRNSPVSVKKDPKINKFKGWEQIKQLNLPLNSCIITDNYLFSNLDSKWQSSIFDNNLGRILENILPLKLDLDFQITILVEKLSKKNVEKFGEKANSLLIEYKKMLSFFLKSLDKKYSIKFQIFEINLSEVHDRDILTNYYWIHSGHSLDLYENYKHKTVKKDTTLYFNGLFADKCNSIDTYYSIINHYKKILIDKNPTFISEITNESIIVENPSNFTNRLLE